jgi:hypothetical protein
MKIRYGFVSNSSSSSFILAGREMGIDEFRSFTGLSENECESFMESFKDKVAVNGIVYDVDADYCNESVWIGKFVHSCNSGFYGGDEIDLVACNEAMASEQINGLKNAGHKVGVYAITIGE